MNKQLTNATKSVYIETYNQDNATDYQKNSTQLKKYEKGSILRSLLHICVMDYSIKERQQKMDKAVVDTIIYN